MPLIAHNSLPVFTSLAREGLQVESTPDDRRATLRIGLLNLVPDAVLQATERQFLRLLADYADANVYVYPIGVATEHRCEDASEHIEKYYESFASVQYHELDALIVTGANPKTDAIERESFWIPMLEVIDWARERDCSVLCSCLAVHAVMQAYFNTHRVLLPHKQWGIYDHRLLDATHPLVEGVADGWAAPHSHCYDISYEQIEATGGQVLFHSDTAGVHLAVSGSRNRLVLFQGHPEYDSNSLLKEYKREISRWFAGQRDDYPPYPENYFPAECLARLECHQQEIQDAKLMGREQPEFPEHELIEFLDSPWIDGGRRVYHNWLRQIQREKRGVLSSQETSKCGTDPS